METENMADEAITSVPEMKEATPSTEQEATTSQQPTGGEVPSENSEVAKLQAEVERLQRMVKQAQDLQKQADKKARLERIERIKLEKKLAKLKRSSQDYGDYNPEEIVETAISSDKETQLEARIGIQNLILENPEYQELLQKDITLREVIKNNPFALIGDYFDAQDAVEQIKEKLDQRVSQLRTQPKEEKKEVKQFRVPVQPPETSPEEMKQFQNVPSGDKIEEAIKRKVKFV